MGVLSGDDASSGNSQAVEFKLSEVQFMHACHQLWAYRAIGRQGNLLTVACLSICAGLLVWLGVPGLWAWLLGGGALALAGAEVLRDRLWRLFYANSPQFQGQIGVIVTDTHVALDCAGRTDRKAWRDWQAFARTEAFVVLIETNRSFVPVPVSAFDTVVDAAAFEDLVATHLRRLPRRML